MEMSEELNEHMRVRREKMNDYKKQGIDQFGEKITTNHSAEDSQDTNSTFYKEAMEEKNDQVTIAGRIMTKRGKGKVGFTHIQDVTGQIQLYVRKDEIGDKAYELFKTVDLGDIVGVTGVMFKTNVGE